MGAAESSRGLMRFRLSSEYVNYWKTYRSPPPVKRCDVSRANAPTIETTFFMVSNHPPAEGYYEELELSD